MYRPCIDCGRQLIGSEYRLCSRCREERRSADSSHTCDATINPCTCGKKWDYMTRYSNGFVTYTTKTVHDKYIALYGEPECPFIKCE